MNLAELGWTDWFAVSFAGHDKAGLEPARVTVVNRGGCVVHLPEGEVPAEVSGRFRHEAGGPEDFPAVGDWVAVRRRANDSRMLIHAVLPRRTRFSRTFAGRSGGQQILAANIDTVFLLSSLNLGFNPRRIERFLMLARDSGAEPVILLTKSDLCEDVDAHLRQAGASADGATVLAISCVSGEGLKALTPFLQAGRTGVLLGASGVGKSTLINQLTGEDWQAVLPVRESDAKGRHTTTRRELFFLPTGGMLIDTPGIRELQLWEGAEGLDEMFADIEALSVHCRFTDCHHASEPDCAVLAAIAAGRLDPARLASFQKLRNEVVQFGRRHIANASTDQRVRNTSLRKHPGGPPQ